MGNLDHGSDLYISDGKCAWDPEDRVSREAVLPGPTHQIGVAILIRLMLSVKKRKSCVDLNVTLFIFAPKSLDSISDSRGDPIVFIGFPMFHGRFTRGV
ncbi:MAG: hypothetical protein CMO06_10750 [Thalassospira sp.]|nr:hypothetical protein [Thalassospira sp.]